MDTNVTAESTATEQIVLVQIDPTTAVLGVNVRSEANLTADFVASIRELGVLEPVVGHYDQQGQFVVLRGQHGVDHRLFGGLHHRAADVVRQVVFQPAQGLDGRTGCVQG